MKSIIDPAEEVNVAVHVVKVIDITAARKVGIGHRLICVSISLGPPYDCPDPDSLIAGLESEFSLSLDAWNTLVAAISEHVFAAVQRHCRHEQVSVSVAADGCDKWEIHFTAY